MNEMSIFAKTTIFVKLDEIKKKIDGIMTKMNLLEEMNHKIEYEDF